MADILRSIDYRKHTILVRPPWKTAHYRLIRSLLLNRLYVNQISNGASGLINMDYLASNLGRNLALSTQCSLPRPQSQQI